MLFLLSAPHCISQYPRIILTFRKCRYLIYDGQNTIDKNQWLQSPVSRTKTIE